MNTEQIRVSPEVKKEIIRLMPIYSKKIIKEGKETEMIAKILDPNKYLKYGDFVEVLVNYWKDRETKEKIPSKKNN